jgi:regulator of protease activity HflC (stomatin/prohibitin superfamily)
MNLVTFLIVAGVMGVGAFLATRGHVGIGLSVWAVAVLVSQTLQMTASRRVLVALKAVLPQGVDALLSISVRPAAGSTLAIAEDQLQVTPFAAEQVLTLDAVPVNVEAVVLWHMPDAQSAGMSLDESRTAVALVAGPLLVDAITRIDFAALLAEREEAIARLCQDLALKATAWGAVVHAVEIRSVSLPMALEAENDARLLLAISVRLAQHRMRRVARAIVERFSRRARPPVALPTRAHSIGLAARSRALAPAPLAPGLPATATVLAIPLLIPPATPDEARVS